MTAILLVDMDALAHGTLTTPVGVIGVVTSELGVARVGWQLDNPGRLPGPDVDPLLREALKQLREYFAGDRRVFDLPLDLTGIGGHRLAVLSYLRDHVRYGRVLSYGELADRAAGIAARGIGAVMAGNRLPIVIPCHRVVAANGLGGYSGGDPGRELETKRWLMELEGSLSPRLF